MSRNEMSELSLFGSKTAAPKPSFKPALEALDERVVLSTTAAHAPASLVSSSYSSQANQAFAALTNGYNYAYTHYVHVSRSQDAYNGFIYSRGAYRLALYAMNTGSRSAWYYAHLYAETAENYESREYNNTSSGYARAASNYEYTGSVAGFNASLYAPNR